MDPVTRQPQLDDSCSEIEMKQGKIIDKKIFLNLDAALHKHLKYIELYDDVKLNKLAEGMLRDYEIRQK
ncbi:hypothetical protein [Exiguobacterium sp. ERU656]|uniref:hypothetical protein n=1 Tax=Exiguobacterium sp. ERU656 TaxID=2751217 RepID=UPI001BE98B25|nr:hypothetical protein [Exiguobacterium sp. ERU656]